MGDELVVWKSKALEGVAVPACGLYLVLTACTLPNRPASQPGSWLAAGLRDFSSWSFFWFVKGPSVPSVLVTVSFTCHVQQLLNYYVRYSLLLNLPVVCEREMDVLSMILFYFYNFCLKLQQSPLVRNITH